jgi:hypothetical protein
MNTYIETRFRVAEEDEESLRRRRRKRRRRRRGQLNLYSHWKPWHHIGNMGVSLATYESNTHF